MMNNPSKPPTTIQVQEIINAAGKIQRLTVKAFNANNLQNLIFIILNDTYQIIKYDRAILFRKVAGKVSILGISGQSTFNLQTEMSSRLRELVQNLKEIHRPRVLHVSDFSSRQDHWNYFQAHKPSTVFWQPFKAGNEEIGLWLERYDDPEAQKNFEMNANQLNESLLPAYAAAWEKMTPHFSLHKIMPHVSLKRAGLFSLGLIILFFLIPVRMRVVAPCEVIPDKPYVATAPMDGIIDHVAVLPGQEVKKNQVLFIYDKKIPEYHYQTALKDLGLTNADWSRAYALGTEDKAESSKLAMLEYQKKSAEAALTFAQRQTKFLTNRSPVDGLVSINDPSGWRGKPVKMGEKIMEISNPKQTKIRIWIPAQSAIPFDFNEPVKIFLNPIPDQTFTAKLVYITPEVKISEEQIPSLEAEAAWIGDEEHPKLGLKGYAFVYGEKVSLLYYILSRPINFIKKRIG